MKKTIQITLGLLGSILFLTGCYYDNEQELYPNTSNNNQTDTGTVSYVATIQPLMATNCATPSCHAAGAQAPDLSTYQGVFNARDRVNARAVNLNPTPMPPSGAMSQQNRNALSKWIAAGALNN